MNRNKRGRHREVLESPRRQHPPILTHRGMPQTLDELRVMMRMGEKEIAHVSGKAPQSLAELRKEMHGQVAAVTPVPTHGTQGLNFG